MVSFIVSYSILNFFYNIFFFRFLAFVVVDRIQYVFRFYVIDKLPQGLIYVNDTTGGEKYNPISGRWDIGICCTLIQYP